MLCYLPLSLSLMCTPERQFARNSNPPTPHLTPSDPIRLRIPRINIIHTRIHRPQLRTPEPRQIPRDALRQRLQRRRHILIQRRDRRRRFRLHELQDEAFEVVALGQGGAVEDAVGQVGHVEAGEGVWGAGVAADGEEARVEEAEGEDVEDEAGKGVRLGSLETMQQDG